ncbi:MAG: hypothetical protein QOF59_1249 [Actinomycetota bacterium]|nr:hypothetical protein [Actinomycetota bacterium]
MHQPTGSAPSPDPGRLRIRPGSARDPGWSGVRPKGRVLGSVAMAKPAPTPPRMPGALHFTPDADANRLLASEPLAVMLGMLLDQQVPMEWAFTAPALLKQRLGGGPLDAGAIATMDPGALEAVFRDKPALHRYPGSMAKRTQALCAHLVEHYGGRAEGVWDGVTSGDNCSHGLSRFRDSASRRRGSSSACWGSGSAYARAVGRWRPPTGRRSRTSTPSNGSSRFAKRSGR